MDGLPHKIGTLLYAFNRADEVLLIQRTQEPNRGLWSPPGGKLHTTEGEAPHACGCREALEELGMVLAPTDLRMVGIVSERAYLGQAHWLMFLFEIQPRLDQVPPPHREGLFSFFPRSALSQLEVPETDRQQLWPLFWQHRGGFFAAHCDATPGGQNVWELHESRTVASQR